MAPVRPAGRHHHRHLAALRRDKALTRLSAITAAIGMGTVAAVGAIGVYVAKAAPGHHSTTVAPTGEPSAAGGTTPSGGAAASGGATPTGGATPSGGASAPTGSSGNSGNSGGSGSSALSPPSAPPQRSYSPPPVTSGSS